MHFFKKLNIQPLLAYLTNHSQAKQPILRPELTLISVNIEELTTEKKIIEEIVREQGY